MGECWMRDEVYSASKTRLKIKAKYKSTIPPFHQHSIFITHQPTIAIERRNRSHSHKCMRTIDLSSAPRTFEYTPRSLTARSSFIPSPSPPTVPPPPPRPGRTSPCFEMKPAKATPTPRAETRAPSLIPSFFTPKPDSSSNITPKPKPKRAGPKAAPSSNEFDGIEEISEADITIEELQRSEARKAARAMNRLSSSELLTWLKLTGRRAE